MSPLQADTDVILFGAFSKVVPDIEDGPIWRGCTESKLQIICLQDVRWLVRGSNKGVEEGGGIFEGRTNIWNKKMKLYTE